MKIDESKKAFPGPDKYSSMGMSLYDYYIGQAIAGLYANPNFNPFTDKAFIAEIIELAHGIAERAIKHKEDNYHV